MLDGDVIWEGELDVPGENAMKGVRLLARENQTCNLASNATIEFLAFVDPDRIPIYLAAAPPFLVHTENEETRSWLNSSLFKEHALHDALTDTNGTTPWHQTEEIRSRVGILGRVAGADLQDAQLGSNVRVTEILFYAERKFAAGPGRLPTPPPSSPHSEDGIEAIESQLNPCQRNEEVHVRDPETFALPLSSDLLYKSSIHSDQTALAENEAQFIKPPQKPESVPRAKKRLNIGELFDEASDRRKKARRKGGQSISLAACGGASIPQFTTFDVKPVKTEEAFTQDVNKYPSVTNNLASGQTQQSFDQAPCSANVCAHDTHPLSRRATVHSKRPSVAHSVSEQSKEAFRDDSVESRNKQTLSRIVMAGMRMHGLQQRKTSSLAQKQSEGTQTFGCELSENERIADNEFKNIYHQTYKGTAFAFRNSICNTVLPPDTLREVIDKLLALFCIEPG